MVQRSALARVDDPILEQQVALHGEAGSLIADFKLGSGPQLRIAKGDEPFQSLAIPAHFLDGIDPTQPFITQLLPMFSQQSVGCRLFIDAILEQRSLVPSFYEGWKAQQGIDAALASHETEQWIAV
jgi:predicted dehydrogenase